MTRKLEQENIQAIKEGWCGKPHTTVYFTFGCACSCGAEVWNDELHSEGVI